MREIQDRVIFNEVYSENFLTESINDEFNRE